MVLRCSPEQDLADHRPVEINDETPGPPLGRPGHLALKLVTRPGATQVGVHLWRRQQLDERRTVPGLGLTEHEPLGPDRLWRPGDGAEFSHVGQPISRLGGDQDARTDQPTGPGPTLTYDLPDAVVDLLAVLVEVAGTADAVPEEVSGTAGGAA
jgi:hypothetical protein